MRPSYEMCSRFASIEYGEARPRFEAYLGSVGDYRRNEFGGLPAAGEPSVRNGVYLSLQAGF